MTDCIEAYSPDFPHKSGKIGSENDMVKGEVLMQFQ